MRCRRSGRAGADSALTLGSPCRPTDCAPAPASPQPERAPSALSPEAHFSARTPRRGRAMWLGRQRAPLREGRRAGQRAKGEGRTCGARRTSHVGLPARFGERDGGSLKMRRRRSGRAGADSALPSGSPGCPTDCAPASSSPQPERISSAPSPEAHFSAPTARDGAPASHRDGRCARQPRRGERAYRLYASEPQRRMARCSARRMQRAPRHGLTGRGAAGPMWLGRHEAPLREGRRAQGKGEGQRAKGQGRARGARRTSHVGLPAQCG